MRGVEGAAGAMAAAGADEMFQFGVNSDADTDDGDLKPAAEPSLKLSVPKALPDGRPIAAGVNSGLPGTLSLDDLKIKSPVRKGTSLDPAYAKDKEAVTMCPVSRDMMGVHYCLGKIGAAGRFCLKAPGECTVKAHSAKVPESLIGRDLTYFPRTKGDVGLPKPSFNYQSVDGDPIWKRFEGEALIVEGWVTVGHLIEHNRKVQDDEAIDLTAAEDLVHEKPPAAFPATAKKRKALSEGVTLQFQDGENPEDTMTAFASKLQTALADADITLEELARRVRHFEMRLGTAPDSSEGYQTVFGMLHDLKEDVDDTGMEASAASIGYQTMAPRVAHVEADLAESRKIAVAAKKAADTALKAAETALDGTDPDRIASLENEVLSIKVGTTAAYAAASAAKTASEKARATDVSALARDVDGLFEFVQNLARKTATGTSVPTGVTSEEFDALKQDMRELVQSLKHSISGGGPIKMGRFSFDGPQSCKEFLLKAGVKGSVFQFLLDPVSIVFLIRGPTMYEEDFHSQTIVEMKTKRSPEYLSVAASFETQIPPIFAGKKGANKDVTNQVPLLGVKTSSLWDEGNATTGVKAFLEGGVENLEGSFPSRIETIFGREHPDFKALADHMFAESCQSLREFCHEVTTLFTNLRFQTYGGRTCSAAEQVQIWETTLIFVEVYFHEMFNCRSQARHISAYEDELTANSVALWASLQAHRIHRQFKKEKFREHPRLFPKLQAHFQKTCVRTESFAPLAAKVATAVEDISDLQKDLAELTKAVNRLASRIGRECGGQGADDGAAAAGGKAMSERAKKRQKKQAAAKAKAEAEADE